MYRTLFVATLLEAAVALYHGLFGLKYHRVLRVTRKTDREEDRGRDGSPLELPETEPKF